MFNSRFFTVDFWLGTAEPFSRGVGQAWIIAGWALVIAAVALLFWKKSQTDKIVRRILARAANWCLGLGIFVGLYWFFRLERSWVLAWRVWLLILGAVYLYKAARLIIYAVKRYPEIKQEKKQKFLREKYLPK